MPTLLPADLERRLLRKSVALLTSDRDTCADCGRTPLYGELLHRYGSAVVCELCRTLRPDAPDRTDRVRHCEHGQTVKVLRAA